MNASSSHPSILQTFTPLLTASPDDGRASRLIAAPRSYDGAELEASQLPFRNSSMKRARAILPMFAIFALFACSRDEQTSADGSTAPTPNEQEAQFSGVDDPPVYPTVDADVDVTVPVDGGSGGTTTTVSYHIVATVDSAERAMVAQTFNTQSLAGSEPGDDGSRIVTSVGDSFADSSRIELGSGVIAENGAESPIPSTGSSLRALPEQGPAADSKSNRVLAIAGDFSASALENVRSGTVNVDRAIAANDKRSHIAETNSRVSRATLVRERGVDSLWIDAATGLVLREHLGSGPSAFKGRYEYTRVGGLLVQTSNEMTVPAPDGRSMTITRRLSNVRVK